MASRDTILENLKVNKPELIDLPVIDVTVFEEDLDLVGEFTKKLEVVGGQVVNVKNNDDINSYIEDTFTNVPLRYSSLDNHQAFNTINLDTIKNAKELENLDLLVLESSLGVAENGALWLSNNDLPLRVSPFITKHLAIILSEKDIVSYMHQAYDKLRNRDYDYGVFVSGPSKTADIEQSLVIGAQGALSLTVFLKE